MFMKAFTAAAMALAAALTLASPALADPTVINFDVDAMGNPIAANTPITTQYAAWGVTFLGVENGQPVNVNAAPDPDLVPAPSSPNVMTNCANALSFCNGNRADLVQISFASPVSNISLMLDSLGGQSVTFNLYDALNNLLETQTVTSGNSSYVPVNFASSGVSRIDGLQPDDGWAWAFDNLTFNGSAVPEPSTWAMMLLGFGGIGLTMRRRQPTLAQVA